MIIVRVYWFHTRCPPQVTQPNVLTVVLASLLETLLLLNATHARKCHYPILRRETTSDRYNGRPFKYSWITFEFYLTHLFLALRSPQTTYGKQSTKESDCEGPRLSLTKPKSKGESDISCAKIVRSAVLPFWINFSPWMNYQRILTQNPKSWLTVKTLFPLDLNHSAL